MGLGSRFRRKIGFIDFTFGWFFPRKIDGTPDRIRYGNSSVWIESSTTDGGDLGKWTDNQDATTWLAPVCWTDNTTSVLAGSSKRFSVFFAFLRDRNFQPIGTIYKESRQGMKGGAVFGKSCQKKQWEYSTTHPPISQGGLPEREVKCSAKKTLVHLE